MTDWVCIEHVWRGGSYWKRTWTRSFGGDAESVLAALVSLRGDFYSVHVDESRGDETPVLRHYSAARDLHHAMWLAENVAARRGYTDG